MENRVQFHGSDLEAIEEFYHIPKEEIVCFGANVNPLGLSERVRREIAGNLDVLSSYPDRNYTALKRVIEEYCGISSDYVVVGNGSTELISLLIQTRKPERSLLLGPTYSEYGRELGLVGGEISSYNLREADNFKLDLEEFCAEIGKGYELVIVCNPNNPTSSALTVSEIRQVLNMCRENGSFLMIDETYVEFAPSVDAISAMSLVAEYKNLMVLRGTSKFFAAPGMRFGYGATSNPDFLKALGRMQNPWSLNSLAAFAGEIMLTDAEYIQKTRKLVLGERDRMCEFLRKLPDVTVYPAYANFVLVKLNLPGVTSFDLFDALIKEKMMVRDCSSFESLGGEFIRFCVMKPEDNDRLLDGIRRFVEGHLGRIV